MRDDYLWDKSGEPDPELKHLERTLGSLRYKHRPLDLSLLPRLMLGPGLSGRMGLAAAGVVLVALAVALWFGLLRHNRQVAPHSPSSTMARSSAQHQSDQKESQSQKPSPAPAAAPKQSDDKEATQGGPLSKKRREPARLAAREDRQQRLTDYPVAREPLSIPFLDLDTAWHIEKAQLLLRSFRNAPLSKGETKVDVSYEKRLSRELLGENILLRRNAEIRGNLPIEELLSSLEPFLLDIANLQDNPSTDDLKGITERMQKKGIVAELQLYSTTGLSASL